MKGRKWLTAAVVLAGMAASTAQAGFYAACDKFGYTITMTKYATLEDAQSGANPGASYDSGQYLNSDGSLYFVRDIAGSANYNAVLTAWSYTTVDNTNGKPKNDPDGDRYYSGWGNPSNTDTGFMQLYEVGASAEPTVSGFWSVLNLGVADGSTFQVNASGQNADYASAWARLWYGGVGGAGELTAGVFRTWNLDFTAAGLTANMDGGMAVSEDHPTDVTGRFWGIFENQSKTDPSLNGFYAFEANFNNKNWAWDNRDNLNGPFANSYFGAEAVPEPFTMALGAAALALGLRRRLRKKS